MNRILRNSLIIAGLLGSATGLYIYFKKQFTKLADSCYTISGGIIHSISLENVNITLLFNIKNTSDLEIQIENIVFNIYVNNMFVTKILKKQKQTLLSNQPLSFQLDCEFSPRDLLKAGLTNLTTLLTNKNNLIINIKGTFDASMSVVKLKNYAFDEKISLADLTKPKQNPSKC